MIKELVAGYVQGHPSGLKRALAAVGVVLAALLFSLLFGSGLSLAAGGLPSQELPLDSAEGEGFHLAEDGSLVIHPEGALVHFGGLSVETANLRLEYLSGAENPFPVTATLSLTGDDAAGDDSFLADEALLAPSTKPRGQTMLLHSQGRLHSLGLEFTPANDAWTIRAITLNGGGFSFNWLLFLLLCALGLCAWAVVAFGWWKLAYNDETPAHRWLGRAAAGLCAGLLAVLFFISAPPGRKGVMWRYDPALTPAQQTDQYPGTAFYSLLFDAFWNGRLDLRVDPDPALADLENPYDRSQRGDIPTLWDTSYYNGRYYCYFGPGPVVFYYAFYLVTGHQPSPGLACTAAAMLAALLLWAALRQLLLYYSIKPNLVLLLLLIPAVVFGSLTALLASCADAYAQPYLWGGAALAGTVWMFHAGLRAAKAWQSRLWLAGAGCWVVMMAACRPTGVLLCLVFCLPAGLRHLRVSPRPAAARALDVAALAGPVATGAALLMAYNAARFGSVLEFGQQYQLTVGDMQLQHFRTAPAWLWETLRYYLFLPLQPVQRFPFVAMVNNYPLLFGNRFYSDPFFGLMNLPLFLALFAIPLALRQSDGVKKAVYLLCPAAVALIWWFDFSIANFLYRYLADGAFALALLSALVLLQLAGPQTGGEALAKKHGLLVRAGQSRVGYALCCLCCLATTWLGLLLAFAGDRHTVYLNHPEVFSILDNLLRLR